MGTPPPPPHSRFNTHAHSHAHTNTHRRAHTHNPSPPPPPLWESLMHAASIHGVEMGSTSLAACAEKAAAQCAMDLGSCLVRRDGPVAQSPSAVSRQAPLNRLRVRTREPPGPVRGTADRAAASLLILAVFVGSVVLPKTSPLDSLIRHAGSRRRCATTEAVHASSDDELKFVSCPVRPVDNPRARVQVCHCQWPRQARSPGESKGPGSPPSPRPILLAPFGTAGETPGWPLAWPGEPRHWH